MEGFTLADTLKVCENRSNATTITRFTPLRCMKRDAIMGAYRAIPYEYGHYIAISYSWPGGWTRLHSSNTPSMVQGPKDKSPAQCSHFSAFSRQAVEHAIGDADWSVWLDYVCIDQSNNDEKSVQVALMDRFYNEARLTIVLLEDIQLSSEEFDFLQGNLTSVRDHSQGYVQIVRRIIKARWFTRAWCSQEWVLSRSPVLYVHHSDDPFGRPLSFSWATLKHWMNRASIFDPTISELQLTDPRGVNPRGAYAIHQPIAWAFGIVHDLGCFNPYDKVALVNNLIHVEVSDRLVDLPPPAGDAQVAEANVVKLINTLAMLRDDYSLLLTNHVDNNPLQGAIGFPWAGPSIRGDLVSQSWTPKMYQIQMDDVRKLDIDGLRLKGIVAEVCDQDNWEFVRRDDGLHVSVNGKQQPVVRSDWLSENYPIDRPLQVDRSFFRDFCYVIEAFNLIEVYQLVFDLMDEQWPYDPGFGSLKAQIQTHFSHYSLNLMFYVSHISFLWAGNVGRFSIVTLSDGSKSLVRGNVSVLKGKTIFQPYVLRPKRIGPHIPTVNSLVVDSPGGGLASPLRCGCIGGVRGFGLFPESGREIETNIA